MNRRSVAPTHRSSAGGAVDFTLTADQEALRRRVRAWLTANIPDDWKKFGLSEVPRPEAYDFLHKWQKRLYDAGFIGLTWPKESGGQGLTFMEEMIVQEEMALQKAPPMLNILGVGMAGPTINAYGTEEQKKRYPAKILSCEEIWCQGYSEPNSGSDLASLQTRAVKDGDSWVINGQKVWTSLAHIADFMMLLARTDPDAPKHKGITYFLIDMTSPGIEIRPLREITGDNLFNEVFFDEVFVPDEMVVGQVNDGWRLARTTLANERVAMAHGTALGNPMEELLRTVTELDVDPAVADQLGELIRSAQVGSLLDQKIAQLILGGQDPGPQASARKLIGVRYRQALSEFRMELSAGAGLVENKEVHDFLNTRCLTIAGGTEQILLTMAGERLLGLPR